MKRPIPTLHMSGIGVIVMGQGGKVQDVMHGLDNKALQYRFTYCLNKIVVPAGGVRVPAML